jgi:hypothetical protein
MEDSTYRAKLVTHLNAMEQYTFVYNSEFSNPLVNRKLVHGNEYTVVVNSHTLERYNIFSMGGKFDRGGYLVINFGVDILEKILTIGNPPQFQKIL